MRVGGMGTFMLGAFMGTAAVVSLASMDPGMRRAMRCRAAKATRKAMRAAGSYFR